MNLSLIHLVLYRTIGIIICLFLLLGALGMVCNQFYLKGIIGILAAIIIGFSLRNAPSIKSWTQVLIFFLIALYIVGISDKL